MLSRVNVKLSSARVRWCKPRKFLKHKSLWWRWKTIIKALFDVKIFAQNEFVIPCHPFGNKIDEKYFRGSQKCYFYPHIIYSKEPIQGVDEAMFKLRVEICQLLCFPGWNENWFPTAKHSQSIFLLLSAYSTSLALWVEMKSEMSFLWQIKWGENERRLHFHFELCGVDVRAFNNS